MYSSRTISIACLSVLLSCIFAFAQPPHHELSDPSKDYDWKKQATRAGLGENDIKHISTDKILITNEAFRQVFDPYLESNIPVFITSDSLLNAFHVLYEESIIRLETQNARKLPEILRFIWKNLSTAGKDVKGNPKLLASAKTKARVIIGTALKLTGDETIKPDKEIAALITEEVERITAAKETMMPKWLGPPDSAFLGIDYTRYKPKGFYTKSELLQRYFRALSWLQSIPLRVSKDEEFLCALLLGNCLSLDGFEGDFVKRSECKAFFRRFSSFIGVGDDWDIFCSADNLSNGLKMDLDGRRFALKREKFLGKNKERPEINDQFRFPPVGPHKASEPNFRIISAYRTPDAVLFHRTTDLRVFGDTSRFPSGLEVCAVLGSSYATSELAGKNDKKLMEIIDQCKPFFKGSSLYFDYMDCLTALLDEPEPDAPKFMSSEPWKIKSCQTALAGWAQLRHTWALQVKQTVMYSGGAFLPPGFVEPEPEFFARMGMLVKKTEALLKTAGAFGLDLKAIAADCRTMAAFIREKKLATEGEKALERMSADEETRLRHIMHWVGSRLEWIPGRDEDVKDFFKEALKQLDGTATAIEKGELSKKPELVKALRKTQVDIEPLWRALSDICAKLEALAHKQLRGVPFNETENSFLKGYGREIARIMFYGGNSYLSPNDDSPRIVDVYSNPNVKKFLEVGIARPRALYVLYPTKSGEILCRGAVMPYYEFKSSQRLTDGQWKEMLDSKDRPDVPKWVKPVIGESGIKKPGPKDH